MSITSPPTIFIECSRKSHWRLTIFFRAKILCWKSTPVEIHSIDAILTHKKTCGHHVLHFQPGHVTQI